MKRLSWGFWLLVVGLVLLIGFQAYMLQTGSVSKKSMYDRFQEIPDPIFYLVFGVLPGIGILLTLFAVFTYRRWSRVAAEAVLYDAKRIAASSWHVEGTRDTGGLLAIWLRNTSWSQWSFLLPIRPGHPDIDQFRKLKTGDIVKFTSLSEGMDCALEHELCGVLRIKKIIS